MNIALLADRLGWHLFGWADTVSQRKDVEKVFLSDPSRQNVETIRGYLGDRLAAVYDSPEALFRENEVEIAIVDTAPIRTPDMVQASLEAGVPVIVGEARGHQPRVVCNPGRAGRLQGATSGHVVDRDRSRQGGDEAGLRGPARSPSTASSTCSPTTSAGGSAIRWSGSTPRETLEAACWGTSSATPSTACAASWARR